MINSLGLVSEAYLNRKIFKSIRRMAYSSVRPVFQILSIGKSSSFLARKAGDS